MSVSPYAVHLPLSFDEDSDLFEGDFDEYGEDLDDFDDDFDDDFGDDDDDDDDDDFGDDDQEIDELLAEGEMDDMEFGAEDDEDDDFGDDDDDSDFDDLDADLDSLGGDEFGIALRNIRMTSTAKLRKIVTGRWRRKKIRMAALKEIMRRERRRSRGAQPQQPQYQPTSNYYQQPQGYYPPAQQSSSYYYSQPSRWSQQAPRHSTAERQTFTPQQEVARQQAAARRLALRQRAQARRDQRQGAARVRAHKSNRAAAQHEARRNAARRQKAARAREARREAARRNAAMRRVQRANRAKHPGMFPRAHPSPFLSTVPRIGQFGVEAAPPPGFTLQPKLGSAMWQHKFKTLAVLGGMYAIGAYVGKERTLDALGPIGDGFENLGRRIRTARA